MKITDEYISKLFEGTNFGVATNNSAALQREQLIKYLKDQLNGYWTGHTAYHILVYGGLLIDSKSGSEKQATALGLILLEGEI